MPTDLLPPPNSRMTNGGNTASGPAFHSHVSAAVPKSTSAMEETASQHYVIGDNLRAKAFYQDAIDEFQKAVTIQEPLLGDTSPTLAKTHYALGLSYRAIKDFQPAMYHLTKATNIYENQPMKEIKDVKEQENGGDGVGTGSGAGSGNGNGNDGGKVASTKKVHTSWFSHPYKQEITDCKLNMARTHHSHGVVLQRAGDYDKSIMEHRKALAIREHLLGKSHLETARSYYVIGCALSDRGSFDEALAELRRALRTRLLIFGKDHQDTKEVVSNLGVVLTAKGGLTVDQVHSYMTTVLHALHLEHEGDRLCRLQEDYANGLVCYRKALSLEEGILGDLHPTTCDLYLRSGEALSEMGDLEASLMEYKSAIQIHERLLGKFHVKVAQVYGRLAGILMDKGEYETALCFYCKSYGIYDAVLGNHDDTKQALMNVRLAAAKERTAKESMGLIKKAEDEYKAQHAWEKQQEQEALDKENEWISTTSKEKSSGKKKKKKKDAKTKAASAPAPVPDDII